MKLNELEKQIILYSKGNFDDYLKENKIEKKTVNIIEKMIKKYNNSEEKEIKLCEVAYCIFELYCKLDYTHKFESLNTRILLTDFLDILVNSSKAEKAIQVEQLIEKLLSRISKIKTEELKEQNIDLGKINTNLI